MSYRSVVRIIAVALSIAVPTEAPAQSALDRAMRLAQEQNTKLGGYKLQPASLDLQPNATTVRSVSGQAVLLNPDQATKSAAYKWEAAFLALSAIDAAETISCLNRNRCTEGNFIWGHHPSTGTIVAAKLGLGLVHFAVFKVIVDRDPHTALRAAQISAVVQGGVVLLNMHKAF
ncbi:hypothetical protein [Sphingomonas sp.]|uniref:hypothetical protein n=1 Tax=Sphingomonas sp. TaxID=28214 RepID=UPI0038A9F63F